MATFSLSKLLEYYPKGNTLSKGENHYMSNHVVECSFNENILKGKVMPSMKDRPYDVQVIYGFYTQHKFALDILGPSMVERDMTFRKLMYSRSFISYMHPITT